MFDVQVNEERTCIADSKIPITFGTDMFGLPLMFCYEFGNYISCKLCKSRNPEAKCTKFKPIKDFKDEAKKEGCK